MASLIIGHGGILDVLDIEGPRTALEGARRRGFRSPGRLPDKAPVRPGRQGMCSRKPPGNWMPSPMQAGQSTEIDRGQIPIGAQALPEFHGPKHHGFRPRVLADTDNRQASGRRIILNRTRQTAPMIIVTSNTGGVGKTVSSRRLYERARKKGLRPSLSTAT